MVTKKIALAVALCAIPCAFYAMEPPKPAPYKLPDTYRLSEKAKLVVDAIELVRFRSQKKLPPATDGADRLQRLFLEFTALGIMPLQDDPDVVEALFYLAKDDPSLTKNLRPFFLVDSTLLSLGRLLQCGFLQINSTLYEDGTTPLHFAALQGQAGVVQFLLGRHADPYAANTEGQTPPAVAERSRSNPEHSSVRRAEYDRVIEILKLAMEKPAQGSRGVPVERNRQPSAVAQPPRRPVSSHGISAQIRSMP